jgi:hypothetical protein
VAGQNSLKPDDLPMEYLLAHFGTKVRRRHGHQLQCVSHFRCFGDCLPCLGQLWRVRVVSKHALTTAWSISPRNSVV